MGEPFCLKIDPLMPVDLGAARVNGYDPFVWALEGRKPAKALDKWEQWMRRTDVGSLCLPLYLKKEVRGTGLRHLRAWAGCEGEQSHTALDDVADTIEVLHKYLTSQ